MTGLEFHSELTSSGSTKNGCGDSGHTSIRGPTPKRLGSFVPYEATAALARAQRQVIPQFSMLNPAASSESDPLDALVKTQVVGVFALAAQKAE